MRFPAKFFSLIIFLTSVVSVLAVPVTLITSPPQSLVYIDDVLIGQSDDSGFLRLNVPTGAKIEIKNIGYFPTTFVNSATHFSTVTVTLKPVSYLSISSIPKNSTFSIDGKEVLLPATVTVATGEHSLKIFKKGYVTQKCVVVTRAFSILKKEFTLQKSGMVHIKSLPEHAQLKVDGNFVAMTPISTNLSSGTHFLTIEATGFSKLSTSLNILKNSTPVSLYFKLKKLAQITIDSSPTGAIVTIGSKTFTAPATLTLEAGTYTYSASQLYSYPTTGKMEITGNGKYVVNLKPKIGLVVFTSNPMGAAVNLDDKLVGQTQTSLQIPYGSHSVKIIGSGGRIWFGKFILNQEIKTVYADMINSGMVLIDARPTEETMVHIGQVWTAVPATLNAVTGIYKVEVFNPNYPRLSRYIQVKSGRVSKYSFSLEPMAKLFVTTKPLNAEVFLDKNLIGKSPLFSADVTAGDHIVAVRWDDGEVEKHIMFEKDKVYNLDFTDPNNVKVIFLSFPDPLRVVVDGKDSGYTPCELSLLRKKHIYEVYDVIGSKISSGEFDTTYFSSKTYFFLDGR